jgi:putative FmdB family regulatory protein
MPTYPYSCSECDECLDLNIPMPQRDDPGPCPACEGKLVRQIAAPRMVWAPTSTSGGHR